jgi:uncharacterized protein
VNPAALLSAVAGAATRRPWLTLGLALALGCGAAALALGLSPSAATSTFVSSSSPEYRATQSYYGRFGEEPVDVVVKGNLQQLLLSSDLERLIGLEGCLSGNVPARALASEGGASGPCGQLARIKTVKAVIGPGTFIQEATEQIDNQLTAQTKQAEAQAHEAQRVVTRAALASGRTAAEAQALGKQASSITMERFQEGVATLALQYGLTAKPSLEDPEFVSTLVFDPDKPAGTPKQRFAYLFPSPDAALISVRMHAGLSQSERTRTIDLIDRAVAMSQWRLQHGETYLVTGEPPIVSNLVSSISRSLELLAIAVLVVMAIALSLVFRGRPRLAPLLSAVLATVLTFGALSLVSPDLTVAQIAVLPVLVGLAVDYAIQLQSRAEEILAGGEPRRGGAGEALAARRAAVLQATRAGGPTIATAVTACAAATLVLLLSPVPMVRGFGVLLAIGIAIAFACALTVGSALLVLAGDGGGAGRSALAGAGPVGDLLGPAWRGARELLFENPLTHGVASVALTHAVRNPVRVLAGGLLLAALGWGLSTQTKVQTDLTKLVPQNTASLRNLNTLERLSGVGGEIDLMISGPGVVKPATIEWMSSYEGAMLKRFGYSASRGCGRARLCPAFSLPDLFQREDSSSASPGSSTAGAGSTGSGSTGATGAKGAAASTGSARGHGAAGASSAGAAAGGGLSQAEIDSLLDAIPAYFSQEVIAPDHRAATLAFGIKLMGLDEQQRVIEAMRAALHPPRGVTAQLVGLPVLAAQANAEVASPWRRLEMLLAGLAAVALVLLIAFRGDLGRALTPLAPVALASGWSALVLFAVRVPLNPMSVTLGVLVIAIATEFSVLLAERHRQERSAGLDMAAALRHTYRHTGAAVVASGVTAIAGFGVLALSDIAMLRDFGLVTVIDLGVSLVGVLIALPAALTLAGTAAESGGRKGRLRLPIMLASRGRGSRAHGQAGHEPV